ncbi:hypothetical protein FF38_00061 [Lucilia cuprina]|uniref:Uncharacterized protein n=1 Tax=Lucilia cuprina TaxID=7375 RepID=A0A0L0BPM6_LUCCU|nr:hypothetical protein FF38_00061 [Lucilia cuprina]
MLLSLHIPQIQISIYIGYATYIFSTISAYCLLTTLRFTFKVGPNSPVGMEKSCGKIVNFCTFWALEMECLLARLMASSMALYTLGQGPAFKTSCINIFTLRDINTVKYLRCSPIRKALEMASHSFLIKFSMCTGGIFSPPAVIIISLDLPVILTTTQSLTNRSQLHGIRQTQGMTTSSFRHTKGIQDLQI